MKLKKGDNILVTRGKDKGKKGTIEKVLASLDKVVVRDVNLYKRHVKKSPTGQKSEIVTITKPLPASVVAVICPSCKKQTRIGFNTVKERKFRVCKKCGKEI